MLGVSFQRAAVVCICTIAFSSQIVVLNQLVSHSFVLHRSFTGLLVDFDNDHPAGGRERMERLHEINYPSLGFHAILDIRDTSSVGRTHFCVLDKGEGTAQNKLPQFRVLQGSKPTDWLKMASTS